MMAEARLSVLAAGPHVTVQDGGRAGFLRFGVPASGAMDRTALAMANVAVGNPAGAAAIEISPGGLTLELTGAPLRMALAGGGFVAGVEGAKFGSNTAFSMHPGQRLTIRPGPWGSWCVLAVAGRLQVAEWLGSAATHAASGFGGGALVPGRVLTVSDARPGPVAPWPFPCPVWARPRRILHVTLGPQERHFAPETVETLLSTPFRLSRAFDRMGLRLDGPPLPPVGALSIPSEPVLRGSVQVSGDGTPSILMADHQPTGGYPKIATLVSTDTDALAQLRPGDALRFVAISPQAAVARARRMLAERDAFLTRISAMLETVLP